MKKLVKRGFDTNNIISYGNMFLIGNGHLGYRGTLEEYSKNEMVGLNIVGFYDRYKKLWRESINVPNPFFAEVFVENKSFSILKNKPLQHEISLDIFNGIFNRRTDYEEMIIKSERFISQTIDNLLCFKYSITLKKDCNVMIVLGTDKDIYEINGPHFPLKEIRRKDNVIFFKGKTNERKTVNQTNYYVFDKNSEIVDYNEGLYKLNIDGKCNKTYTFYCFCNIFEHRKVQKKEYDIKDYNLIKKEHIKCFNEKWNNSDVVIKGDSKAQFALRYSIYHLLILGNEKYQTSIPARGVSGQTYKGAIFWDTEIFLLPFFTLTNKEVSKQLLKYRINTLKGALKKAKINGYNGAFYAWESQEKGQDGCSKYNVSDPITNKPIRTYFGEKQIHISSDIAYGLLQYISVTNDESLLLDGGLELLKNVIDFYISYSKVIDGKYHLNDVIGPDEYHERINDNAFTNYMIYYVTKSSIKYFKKYGINDEIIKKYTDYLNDLYLPPVSSDGLIEQFAGYYGLEDTTVEIVKSRLKHKNEYWGGKNGVATNTRIIKQADVITLLVLLGEMFDLNVKNKNFNFYFPYTEHGSSLSASMYSIIASQIGKTKISYQMFLKSAEIDLGTNQKMFAGGIYIGGTHPASNAGAYLSLLFGMCGLSFKNDKINLSPNLPKKIKGVSFKIYYKNIQYRIIVDKNNNYKVEQVYD